MKINDVPLFFCSGWNDYYGNGSWSAHSDDALRYFNIDNAKNVIKTHGGHAVELDVVERHEQQLHKSKNGVPSVRHSPA